jgi:hypothetical protein
MSLKYKLTPSESENAQYLEVGSQFWVTILASDSQIFVFQDVRSVDI